MLSNRFAVAQRRCISTNSYPFPTSSRPTPHQIFHLSPGATQKDIKARYYDLVRAHHPDSPACRHVCNADRTARFQAIMAAYDALRGKDPNSPIGARHRYGDVSEELARRRRAYERQQSYNRGAKSPQYEWDSNPEERWKANMMIAFGILALVAGIAPSIFILPYRMHKNHTNAVRNYSNAREEALEDANARRQGVRDRAERLRAERD